MVFTKAEFNTLKEKDERLAKVIGLVIPIQREITPNLFLSMVKQMIHQQISMKAAYTLWQRFEHRLGVITPKTILSLNIGERQDLGITMTKALWIHEAAEKFYNEPEIYEHLFKKI